MPTDTTEHRDQSVVSLVTQIIGDAQELTRQQIELFKIEITDGARKAQSIALLVGVGAALAVIAGVVLMLGVAGWLAWAFPGLPSWATQLIVGAVVAIIAGILFGVCKQKLDAFSLVPEKSVEALKENLEWKTKPNTSVPR